MNGTMESIHLVALLKATDLFQVYTRLKPEVCKKYEFLNIF